MATKNNANQSAAAKKAAAEKEAAEKAAAEKEAAEKAAAEKEAAEAAEATTEATTEATEGIVAKVTNRFRDRETGSVFQPGAIVVVSPDRFDEICATGDFLETV